MTATIVMITSKCCMIQIHDAVNGTRGGDDQMFMTRTFGSLKSFHSSGFGMTGLPENFVKLSPSKLNIIVITDNDNGDWLMIVTLKKMSTYMQRSVSAHYKSTLLPMALDSLQLPNLWQIIWIWVAEIQDTRWMRRVTIVRCKM